MLSISTMCNGNDFNSIGSSVQKASIISSAFWQGLPHITWDSILNTHANTRRCTPTSWLKTHRILFLVTQQSVRLRHGPSCLSPLSKCYIAHRSVQVRKRRAGRHNNQLGNWQVMALQVQQKSSTYEDFEPRKPSMFIQMKNCLVNWICTQSTTLSFSLPIAVCLQWHIMLELHTRDY